LFSVLGVPASFAGFLVPIREAGVLLPQLLVAAYVRAMRQRKIVWYAGAVLSALALFFMALVAWQSDGVLAGSLLLLCLVLYSLARGLCSVSAKDVLGKTISKTRRGRVMGYSASLAGVATIVIGLILQSDALSNRDLGLLLVFLIVAGVLWLLALLSFMWIIEPDGATEGGGNALHEALRSLRILKDDRAFRQYVISRILLLSTALVVPFYVILIQEKLQSDVSTLGWLIIINGLASSLSAPLIGRLADESSRRVMAGAAFLAGLAGVAMFVLTITGESGEVMLYASYILFFLIVLAHGAVRLGRKVYLVDLANTDNRAQYVAVSNTVIGVAMLLAGLVGVIADLLNVQSVILLLSIIALCSSLYIRTIPEVSG
ncbi:MAG: MFS transporter, partial [Gammaproteobacteria bacterium]|nr:MFS transporter [Gammaproteobacteria bacterium]